MRSSSLLRGEPMLLCQTTLSSKHFGVNSCAPPLAGICLLPLCICSQTGESKQHCDNSPLLVQLRLGLSALVISLDVAKTHMQPQQRLITWSEIYRNHLALFASALTSCCVYTQIMAHVDTCLDQVRDIWGAAARRGCLPGTPKQLHSLLRFHAWHCQWPGV